MPVEIIIAPALSSHRQAIAALLQAEKLPVDDLPANLDYFFTALDGDTVVGAVGMELYGEYGLLRSLVVDAAYRNHAVAAKLVHAVETKAASLQLKSLYLLTETAKAYFERKGYAPVNRADVPGAIKQSTEFSHVCPVSAVVMFKPV